jgi:hypothetical protein
MHHRHVITHPAVLPRHRMQTQFGGEQPIKLRRPHQAADPARWRVDVRPDVLVS